MCAASPAWKLDPPSRPHRSRPSPRLVLLPPTPSRPWSRRLVFTEFLIGLGHGLLVGAVVFGLVLYLRRGVELAAWRALALAQAQSSPCATATFGGRAYERGSPGYRLLVQDSILRIEVPGTDPAVFRFNYGPSGAVRYLRVDHGR